MYDDNTLAVETIDTYLNSDPPAFGLNITERLFWEAYIMIQDCSRPPDTDWDIGRGSEVSQIEMKLFAYIVDIALINSVFRDK